MVSEFVAIAAGDVRKEAGIREALVAATSKRHFLDEDTAVSRDVWWRVTNLGTPPSWASIWKRKRRGGEAIPAR